MKSSDQRTVEMMELDAIMKIPAGRNVLARILNHSGYFSSTYNPDAAVMANNTGRRDEGIWLVEEMREANPDQLITILKECLK